MKAPNESLHWTLKDRIMVAPKAELENKWEEETGRSHFVDHPKTYEGKEAEETRSEDGLWVGEGNKQHGR